MANTPPGTRRGYPDTLRVAILPRRTFRMRHRNASSSVIEVRLRSARAHCLPLCLRSTLFFTIAQLTMSSPKKRGRSLDFDAIADISKDDVGCKAAVHGVVTQLSPVKSGPKSKYYSGKIADSDSAIRFVSFASKKVDVPASFQVLEGFKAKKEAIQMKNCEVKVNSFTGHPELELHINSSTLFEKSSMTFDVSPESDEEEEVGGPAKVVTVSQLAMVKTYEEPITIKVKVIRVEPAHTTSNGSIVQTVAVADDTGNTTVDLWAEFIDQLKADQSYELSEFRVKSFQDDFTIFSPRKGAHVTAITDISHVIAATEVDFDHFPDATIGSVVQFSANAKCPICKKGNVRNLVEQPAVGRCSSCKSVSRMSLCVHVTAATLSVHSAGRVIQLDAYDDVLAAIANTTLKNVTETSLTMADSFNAFAKYGKIRKIKRQ